MTKRPVVLVVEDELSTLYANALGLVGKYEVETAITAQEALMKVKTSPPDLILLDVMLPGGMTGIEALPELKESCNGCPVLVITAWPDQERQARTAGADEVLTKPVPIRYLMTLISEYVARARPDVTGKG